MRWTQSFSCPAAEAQGLRCKTRKSGRPRLLELAVGYNRTTDLRSSNVKVGTILDAIPKPFPCYDVYRPLQDDLAKIAKSCGAQFVNFPYDWRKDVISSTEKLAAKIKSSVKSSSDEITLVCHSMGNLLARVILESGDYSSKSWFGNIKRYVGICGPHYGVPVILEYTLGLDSWLGISAIDMKTLSKDSRYPSCYQCLPFKGKDVLFDVQSGSPQAKDIYDASVASDYDLDPTNLATAKAMQDKLGFAHKPPGVDYDLISGSNHTTRRDTRVQRTGVISRRTERPIRRLDDSSVELQGRALHTMGDARGSYRCPQVLSVQANSVRNSGLQGSDPRTHLDRPSGAHNIPEQIRLCAVRGNRDAANSRSAHAGNFRIASDRARGRAGSTPVRALPGTTGRLSRPSDHVPSIDDCGAGGSRRLSDDVQRIARNIGENCGRFCGEQSNRHAAVRARRARNDRRGVARRIRFS